MEILQNTPAVLSALCSSLSEEWINSNEGGESWTSKEVVAHLIVCEETDWLPRIRVILSEQDEKTFTPIDMQAHFALSRENSMEVLLQRFAMERQNCLAALSSLQLQEGDFARTAMHPVLGEVNLQQLISTWVTHDLSHIAQIARVLAKQNKDLTGSFKQYLRILND